MNTTDRPTPEQRLELGRRIARSFGIDEHTPSLTAIHTPPADLDAVAVLITTQASMRTWDQILQATPEDIAGNGVPAVILDHAVEGGHTRRTFGERVSMIARDYFRELENLPAEPAFHGETQPVTPHPKDTLVRVAVDAPQGAGLVVGDVVRVVESYPRPGESDPALSVGYSVTRVEETYSTEPTGTWMVRHAHVEPLPPLEHGSRAVTCDNPRYQAVGASYCVPVGSEVTIERGPDHDSDYYATMRDADGQVVKSGYFLRHMLRPVDADAKAVEALTAQAVDDMPEVRDLRAQVERQRAQIAELNRWRSRAESDMGTASERLIAEAERRSWCSEYDQIIDDINGRMSVLSFDSREQEVECEAEVECEVSVELNGYTLNGTLTVTVYYTGTPTEDPCDADYIDEDRVQEHVASALGVSHRSVDVDSWSVESYDAC